MNKTRRAKRALTITAVALACLSLGAGRASAAPVRVEVKRTDEGWQLWRGGRPYLVRGAGGDASLERLAAAGGNSLRTWGADDLEPLLDRAHALGLTVTIGIWLGHERHGFDYRNAEHVREQKERARRAVLRYKDHPALLMWGIGNEMEGFAEGDDPVIWSAVNDIAVMVKKLDPHHPTMTVTAEIGGGRIEAVQELCPAIDVHGINSYGGAPSLPDRYRDGGGKKPYVLTEFGPPGTWEGPKTEWDAPLEPTSTEKAEGYRRAYERAVLGARGLALGSYVFTWGHKMEATPTWYGMFLPDGAAVGAVDVMTELWSGKPPPNLAPRVQPLVLDGEDVVAPGAEIDVRVRATDPEGSALRARWVLRREPGEYSTGGDYRPVPPEVEGAIVESRTDGARVRMPNAPGAYRLLLYVYDDAGGAATANVPLLVEGEVRAPMPFYVYQDGFDGMPWVPSGWMGSTEAIELDGAHAVDPHEGEACVRIQFRGELGSWGGIAWQHPPNDWGDAPGGYDVSGAKYLEVWARGEHGVETISIGVGLLGPDKPHPDSGKTVVEGVRLKKEWQRYRVRLRKLDLSTIKTGFVVTLVGRRQPITVYLDSIRFVGK